MGKNPGLDFFIAGMITTIATLAATVVLHEKP